MSDENTENKRMYLSEVRLWNFRQFGTVDSEYSSDSQPDLVVPFSSGMNVLIGRNDSGKSAIIDGEKNFHIVLAFEPTAISHSLYNYCSRRFI